MVVPVDVFAGEADDLLARTLLPMLGIHGLDLHTAEEPLGRGVVGAAPLRAHGPDQAVPAHPFQPSRPPVMTTAVTVDHGTLAGPQRGGGPVQHRVGQFGVRRRPGRVRHDHAVVAVDHRRKVHLSVAGLDLGDVREPLLVGSFGGEIPVDEVVEYS